LAVLNVALMVSLNAKFKACVGKYLMTLAMLPKIYSSVKIYRIRFEIMTTKSCSSANTFVAMTEGN